MSEKPWRDAETLRRLYWGEELNKQEVADELDCSKACIHKWMQRHGIGARTSGPSAPKKLRDAGWLEDQYHERNQSLEQIGEQVGRSKEAVHYWMKKLGVPPKDMGEAVAAGRNRQPAYYGIGGKGHEVWQTTVGGSVRTIFVHRLLMVSEQGLDATRGKVVHHKNGVPWDNRPENLELMDRAEHSRMHRLEYLSQ